jgi:hypothetical protein
MTNVSRYKIRNEEARLLFCDAKMLRVLKGVFSLMTQDQRDQFSERKIPLLKTWGERSIVIPQESHILWRGRRRDNTRPRGV